MRYSWVIFFASLAIAAPPFSLPNGYPTPSPQQLKGIEAQAGGPLPNYAMPTALQAGAIQSLQVVAFNQLFEVAYFTSLLKNVTDGVEGYTDLQDFSRSYVIQTLEAVRAQEELHTLIANYLLRHVGAKTIGACDYFFPVDNFKDAIALAAQFTDVVTGALQITSRNFALEGGEAVNLIPLLGSIINQEGEQDGGYRFLQKKVPSASAFLTPTPGAFSFNAVAQSFVVPDSCPFSSNVSDIGIAILPTLALSPDSAAPSTANTTIMFESAFTNISTSDNYIAYISGHHTPIVVPIDGVDVNGRMATFKASFPFGAGFSKGLTLAALVNSPGPFSTPTAVANATLAGPGMIEVE